MPNCIEMCAEVAAGSAAWLGRGLSCVCAQRRESDARPSFDLTPSQEECLLRLQNRIDVAYDSSIPEHQEALKALWKVAFPEKNLYGLISEQWKEMGWQGKDPSTDFSCLIDSAGVVDLYHWRTCYILRGISRYVLFPHSFYGRMLCQTF